MVHGSSNRPFCVHNSFDPALYGMRQSLGLRVLRDDACGVYRAYVGVMAGFARILTGLTGI